MSVNKTYPAVLAPLASVPADAKRPAVDVLRGAKAVLEQRGWCQGEVECDGKVCVVGAIKVASGIEPRHGDFGWFQEIEPAHDILAGVIGQRFVAEWNDQEGLTLVDVYAAFDKAIALAETEAQP